MIRLKLGNKKIFLDKSSKEVSQLSQLCIKAVELNQSELQQKLIEVLPDHTNLICKLTSRQLQYGLHALIYEIYPPTILVLYADEAYADKELVKKLVKLECNMTVEDDKQIVFQKHAALIFGFKILTDNIILDFNLIAMIKKQTKLLIQTHYAER